MSKPKPTIIILITTTILFSIIFFTQHENKRTGQIDGEKALDNVKFQLSLGPRVPGSAAHQEVRNWIASELKNSDWAVEKQEANWEGHPIYNIIGKRGNGKPWIVIGAHYDSRLYADRDTEISLRSQPVPGANDGASGVAVLLELARCLPKHIEKTVWLVFFDAEDSGNIAGYDWIMGSRTFVSNLSEKPDQAIIVDMIGDKDLNIFQEKNSNFELTESVWMVARQLSYKQFILEPKYRLLDDHIPFIEAGIPAIDIIDFNYIYWHTSQDTLDKISPQSLQIIGDTLLHWLQQ